MPDTHADTDGAYVEYLATELGAMLLPEDYERLMALARSAEAAGRLRAALVALEVACEVDKYAHPPSGLAAALAHARDVLREVGP
jgi:hypothetical protein